MKKIYTLLTVILLSINGNAQIVISQVYGGGGNTGATYSNDFIELFNRGSVAVNVTGWSVQYASANGITWSTTLLPNVSILPGQYYLIQEAAGTTPVLALPTPDLNGITCGCTYNTATPPAIISTGIAMSGSNGKVILVSSTTAETTADPTGPQIIDKVAYGATSTSGFEGTGPTGTALTNSTSAQRNLSGCSDTNNNSTDFTVATPAPRNSSTAINTCALSVKQNSIAGLNVYPNPVTDGNLYITSNSSNAKTVAVYDILGKQVLNAKTSNNSVNVANLKGGAYIIKITEDGKTDTRKLIIE